MQLIVSLFLAGIVAIAAKADQTDFKAVIYDYLERERSVDKNQVHKRCYVEKDANKCSLHNMAADESNLVYPGGNTRCIFSTSTPFAFQVFPGDKDKVLFYFQGGGACWDKISTDLRFCSTDISPQSSVGIFDRTNDQNAFKSYTIVHVLYCSGDIHAGNTTRRYDDSAGQPVVQVGLVNTQAAVTWIQDQVSSGALASTFSSFVVMGCSAGSVGAQVWAEQLLKTFSWQHAAVVPDSYAGVFPPGSSGPLVYNFGYCSSTVIAPALVDKCNKKQLELSDITMSAIESNPHTSFSSIQSKSDVVQISFYDAIGFTTNTTQRMISPSEFYTEVIGIFSRYNSPPPNFVNYLIDGPWHCYTNQGLYYTADTRGPTDDNKDTDTIALYKWINQLPLSSGQSISTECDGNVQQLKANGKITEDVTDNAYCSANLVPKTYTQQ